MKKPRPLKYKKILFAVAGVLIFVTTSVVLMQPKADTGEDIIWREYPVAYNDITASLDGGGALEADGVPHSFDIDLKVEQILVEVGQEVQIGDLLVNYSVDTLKEKIAELNVSLQKAQRALTDAKNSKQKAKLENALNADKTNQDSQTTYEGSKRELANSIRTAKKKIQQLEETIAELRQDLKDAENSEDGSADSDAIKKLKAELEKLREELKKLETNDGKDEQINSPENAAYDADAIKQKQAEIDEVLKQIAALSSKEERITSLKEQLRRTQSELESAEFELETQQIARNKLERNHDHQVDQTKENQAIQEQIDALTNAALDSAVENAQAEVENIQKDLVKANQRLNTPVLTATADGVVIELKYTEGDDVPAGKTIVTVGNSDEKRVVTQVSQEDIVGVEIGQAVEMQFLSAPDETLKGSVLEKNLVPSEGGDGVTYKVTIGFDEEQTALLQGMTCSVKFILKRVENVLTLSNKAIALKNGKQIVTVLLPDGTHEEREIQTGFSDGRVSEITGGLSGGETVVTAG